jgi:hypothetical protein
MQQVVVSDPITQDLLKSLLSSQNEIVKRQECMLTRQDQHARSIDVIYNSVFNRSSFHHPSADSQTDVVVYQSPTRPQNNNMNNNNNGFINNNNNTMNNANLFPNGVSLQGGFNNNSAPMHNIGAPIGFNNSAPMHSGFNTASMQNQTSGNQVPNATGFMNQSGAGHNNAAYSTVNGSLFPNSGIMNANQFSTSSAAVLNAVNGTQGVTNSTHVQGSQLREQQNAWHP